MAPQTISGFFGLLITRLDWARFPLTLTRALALLLVSCSLTYGQAENEPVLRLEAEGPTSYVTSIAFSPNGRTLYAGSWDKTVYVWKWDDAAGEFRLDPLATLRVPIGPGLDGAINTIAVSPDGIWVAAAGTSPIRGAADYRRPGQVIPTLGGLSSEMRQDAGTIYAFDTRSGQTYSLRGHSGEVRALALTSGDDRSPVLVSAAREWNEEAARYDGVVRVWESLTNPVQPLKQVLPVPSTENSLWLTWPRLAVRRTAQELRSIEVAIAWGDDTFRLWDVSRNQMFEVPRQGRFQDVVALNQQSSQFFSGVLGEDESFRLRAWKAGSAARPEIDPVSTVEMPRSRDHRFIPRGLAFASSSRGATCDVMAVVVHRNIVRDAASDQYELWLFRAPFRGVRPQVLALWKAGPPPRRTPQIAASPGGAHVAISREGEIYVYAVADLVTGKNQPKILRNAGAAIDDVAFVRQRNAAGAPLGLRLSEQHTPVAAGPAPGDKSHYIFDLARSRLQPHTAGDGWIPAPGTTGNWRIDLQTTAAGGQPMGRQLVVSEGGVRNGVIPLPAAVERTVFNVSGNARPPVVALATYEGGLPALGLYDAATGKQIRQLTSHSARIRSLAFSDDGKHLVSAADDETVCVWSLADLDRIAGKRGKTPGITVRQTQAGLSVHFDSAAGEHGFSAGDTLVGQTTAAGTRPWTTPREFYDAFWNATPGESIRVRRRKASGAEDEVAIPVVQGVDERKPLFSLFIARGAAGQSLEWIGWSPLGPYQSSQPEIERYLGWHFNTGRPDAPVAFAAAAQYRDKYFRPGLIDNLIKTGQPPQGRRADLSLPRPNLDLIVEGSEIAPGGDAEDVLIRKPPAKASLLVENLSADQIEKVELALDGKPLATLQPHDDGTTWSAVLDAARWRPGEFRLKAVVYTREASPQSFDVERRVRFQKAAPQITIDTAVSGLSGIQTDQDSLALAASVEPARSGEPTDVVLKRKEGDKETILKRWTTSERLEIKEMIDVAEGGSQLEIIARNRDALPGFEAQETERKQLAVNRHRAVVPPPVITSAQVEPISPGQTNEPLVVGNGPRNVTVDRVRLSGELTGPKEDLVVESSLSAAGAELHISPAADGRRAQFSTDEIKLQPGLQTISVRRKTLGGPVITTTIELDYRPPLPELTIEHPQPQETFIAGRDSAQVDIVARLRGLAPDPSLQAAILINGEPIATAPIIDRAARTITAQLPVPPGGSQIGIKLWDAWNEGRVHHVSTIRYLQLPSIDRITAQNEQLPVLDLTISGQSATPLTQVQVGADLLPASTIQYDQATGRWQATARAVRGEAAYELVVQARNRDGQALVPAKWQVAAWRQRESPPLIELVGGGNVTAARYELHFTVRSRSRLRSINIKHNEQPVEFDSKLAEQEADSSGWFVFKATAPVQLASGDNRLEVLAANDGGAEGQQLVVNYIDPPARIVIDRIETVGGPERVVLPISVQDRRARAAGVAPTGKVLVHGRVNWPLSTDQTYLARKQRLQLWVNGFQQAPGALNQPTKNDPTSEFTAFAVLNEKKANRVQLALPDLTPDIATLFDFEVDCAQPVLEQRLHVLIVGVGTPRGSEPELERRVLEALQAKPLRDKLWRSAAFDQIAAYGPLVGNDITPQQVRNQLSHIKLKIDELYHANRSSARPANDVVMIYLQGGALINVAESFFITTRPASDPRTSRAVSQLEPRILMDVAVQSRTLANFLTHTTGAHVLLLDVTGNLQSNEGAQWPEDSRAAMLRYTWLKGPQAPARARLLAALPEALKQSSRLSQLDSQFAEYNRSLATQYPQSSAYSRQVPEILQNLLLGQAP
jgi:WD40 repeat protein